MESDAFVSVCDGSSGQPQVFIVDLKNGNQVMKRPMSAEAAIMNPVSKILALRAGQQLQIFNLELRAKMKSHQMPEAVVFWRWVSPNTIALVTPTAVALMKRCEDCSRVMIVSSGKRATSTDVPAKPPEIRLVRNVGSAFVDMGTAPSVRGVHSALFTRTR